MKLVTQLGEGNCFGERALQAEPGRASATVTAMKPTTAITITKENYLLAIEWSGSSKECAHFERRDAVREALAIDSVLQRVWGALGACAQFENVWLCRRVKRSWYDGIPLAIKTVSPSRLVYTDSNEAWDEVRALAEGVALCTGVMSLDLSVN